MLRWRNPRIHGPERTKEWLACDEHRAGLADFLARRDFPLRVEPLLRRPTTALGPSAELLQTVRGVPMCARRAR